jgi:hypothetical protein
MAWLPLDHDVTNIGVRFLKNRDAVQKAISSLSVQKQLSQ